MLPPTFFVCCHEQMSWLTSISLLPCKHQNPPLLDLRLWPSKALNLFFAESADPHQLQPRENSAQRKQDDLFATQEE